MLRDIFDIVSSGGWKVTLVGILLLIGGGIGLHYLYQQHTWQQAQSTQKAARMRAQKRKATKQRHHLSTHRRLVVGFSFRLQTPNIWATKRFIRFDGWLQARQQGLAYLIQQSPTQAILLFDRRADGPDEQDQVGTVRLHKRQLLVQGKLQAFSTLDATARRTYQTHYKYATHSALEAIQADLRHIGRLKALRKSHPALIAIDEPGARKPPYWPWRTRKLRRMQLIPSPTGLQLIYRQSQQKYGCQRQGWRFWQEVCKGKQTTQTLFLDRGAPGLNPGDGDRHGQRILRDGKIHQDKELQSIDQLSIVQLLALRQAYRRWSQLFTEKLFPATPLSRPTTRPVPARRRPAQARQRTESRRPPARGGLQAQRRDEPPRARPTSRPDKRKGSKPARPLAPPKQGRDASPSR